MSADREIVERVAEAIAFAIHGAYAEPSDVPKYRDAARDAIEAVRPFALALALTEQEREALTQIFSRDELLNPRSWLIGALLDEQAPDKFLSKLRGSGAQEQGGER